MGVGFALVFEKEKGAADFSYKPDNKEKVGENEKPSGESSGKSSQKIMDYMKNQPDITTQEIADLMKMSRRNIAKHISNFKNKGMIKRIGSDKSGYWRSYNYGLNCGIMRLKTKYIRQGK